MRFLVKFILIGLGLMPVEGFGQVQESLTIAKIKSSDSLPLWKTIDIWKPVSTWQPTTIGEPIVGIDPNSFVDPTPLLRPLTILKPVPISFYHQNLGFMCKSEWKVEKVTRVPLRVRLGSVAQTNYLEGKR